MTEGRGGYPTSMKTLYKPLGLLFGLVRAAIDRAGAKGYQKLTGVWPDD